MHDPKSLESWRIKRTDESLPRVDSSVSLMHHDPRLDHPNGTRPKIKSQNVTIRMKADDLFFVVVVYFLIRTIQGNC